MPSQYNDRSESGRQLPPSAMQRTKLPMTYQTYIFDLYGTLVDIHTEDKDPVVWEKLALFMSYYQAFYEPDLLEQTYRTLVQTKEQQLKSDLECDPRYTHEASPEIELSEVFAELYRRAGVEADFELVLHTGQFYRALATEYLRLYEGTPELLASLKKQGKTVYLLSNAQRIFTAYEMQKLKISKYFDDILISSDYRTKKPDERFFRILLEKHPMDVTKALFIGNDSRTDIMGAKQVGLDTFYICSNISPKGDHAPDATYAVNDFQRWSAE